MKTNREVVLGLSSAYSLISDEPESEQLEKQRLRALIRHFDRKKPTDIAGPAPHTDKVLCFGCRKMYITTNTDHLVCTHCGHDNMQDVED